MGVFGFLKEHEAHGSESKKPMAELIANADPSDDRAFHVQVAFCCFLEPTPGAAFRAAAGPPDHRAGLSAAGPRT
jgi:hypothetical protein